MYNNIYTMTKGFYLTFFMRKRISNLEKKLKLILQKGDNAYNILITWQQDGTYISLKLVWFLRFLKSNFIYLVFADLY